MKAGWVFVRNNGNNEPDLPVDGNYVNPLEIHRITGGPAGFEHTHLLVGGVALPSVDRAGQPDAAPITSPRTCEPGPGTLTANDTGNKLSISGGALVVGGGTTWGNPRIVGGSQTRAAGLSALVSVTPSVFAIGGYPVGFATTATPGTEFQPGVRFRSTALGFELYDGTSLYLGLNTYTNSTAYPIAIILRSTGAFFFLKISGSWKLQWPLNIGSTATLYPAMSNYNNQFTLDYFRVAQLPAPFDTDDGIATDSIASPSVGNTFTHEADCIIEFTVTTLGTNISIDFRRVDTNNRWNVNIGSGGDLKLYEVVSGGVSLRSATAGGFVTNGERVVIICDDTTITGYSDNTAGWTYSSASNFKTATGGYIGAVTGATVSNLITWPRTLSGTAATVLDQYTA